MRKYHFLLGIACLLAAPTMAQNLLTNGDFETDTTGWALLINNSAATGAATVSFHASDAAHSGSYGAKIQITTAQPTGDNYYIQLGVPMGNITLQPNRSYTLTYWVKASSARTEAGAFQAKLDDTSYTGIVATTNWTQGQVQVASGNTVTASLTIKASLGADTGTYDFDDFVFQDMGPAKGPSTISFPTAPALKTGIYRDLFAEYGYSQANIDDKVNGAFNQLFFGDSATQRLYRIVPGDTTMGFIDATDYVLTEGQSYGMMIAVQMNRKDIFDKFWKFAKTHMQQKSGDQKGYFAWKVASTAPFTPSDVNPAPDGEEYFATSLFLADKRWGSATGVADLFNYKQQADSILTYILTSRASLGPLVDPVASQPVFSPAGTTKFSDPSYHLPAFYRLWAAFSSHDTARWSKMADTSAAFFLRCSKNSSNGIMPDYANFDGSPALYSSAQVTDSGANARRSYRYDTVYAADAHRTPMNIGAYWNWFQKDTNSWSETDKFLGFLRTQGGANLSYNQVYSTSGLPCAPSGWSPAESQVGSNAAAVLSSRDTANWAFVQAAFNQATPTGQYRYYNGMVYMLALLHISGNFKAWGSPGMLAMAGVQPEGVRTARLIATLRGRELSLSGVYGTRVRLLDLRGHVAATASVDGQIARLIVPGAGLWIVDAGKARTSIAVP